MLRNFSKYCKESQKEVFEEIDSNLLKGYSLHLQEVKKNTLGGVAFQFRVIRALFGFANREEIP